MINSKKIFHLNPQSTFAESAGTNASWDKYWKLLCLLIMICMGLAHPVLAQAQSAKNLTVDQANIGFKNLVKPGFWSPVNIKFKGLDLINAGDLTLWVHTEDDQNDLMESPIGKLVVDDQGLTATAKGWFLYGHPKCKLEFSLRNAEGKTLWRESVGGLKLKLTLLRAESRLLIVVGNQDQIKPEQFEAVIPGAIPIFYDTEELPLDPLVRDGVSSYLFLGELGLSIAGKNSTELEQYVRGGGHILLSEGMSASDWANNPMSKWVPITLDRELKIKDLGAFQNYTEHSSPLWSDALLQAVTVSGYSKKLISTLDGTFAARSNYGFGFVTFLGINVGQAPLRGWNSLPRLLGKLLDLSTPKSVTAQTSEVSRSLTQTGITDIKTHIQACLNEQFETHGFTIYQIFGTLLLSILLIGPFDYFLCHLWLKRPYLTWLTLPVIGLSLAVFLAGMTTTSKNRGLSGSQFTLLDYETKSNTLRFHHQTELFAEEASKVSINIGDSSKLLEPIKISSQPESFRGSWSGEQEDSFGGIRRIPSNSHDTGTYRLICDHQAPGLLELDGLPVRKWSTREVQCQGISRLGKNPVTNQVTSLIPAELYGTLNGQLVGYLMNNIDTPLNNWVICYGRRIYFPVDQEDVPTIPAKGRIKIDDDRKVRSRDLIGYMTNESTAQIKRKYGVGEDIIVTQTEYDLKSRDLPYIISRLTFYDILGGSDYTSLSNHELEHLDLSSYLDMDYAVFLAEIDAKNLVKATVNNTQIPVTETTFLRVLIPVGRPDSKNYGIKYKMAPELPGPIKENPQTVNPQPVLPQPQQK